MKLDYGEAFNAAVAGLQRQFRAIQRKASNLPSYEMRDEFVTHIHGAIAEATVAKALGMYCNMSSPDRGIADVGANVEVRSSTNPKAKMPIRLKDKDDAKFYFVVGIYPNTKIIGWMYGKDCKQSCYRIDTDKDGKKLAYPYWAVPQSDLNPELIEVIL